jgi:arylsulfatase A-like enzyme
MPPIRSWHAAALISATLGGASLLAFRPAPPAPGPALVLVVVVDQMRGDYLQRWQGQWKGGFARLLGKGAVFPNGFQDHAITSTAPGHATILSGRHPVRSGIYDNQHGVGDSTAPLVGGVTGPGASPSRFRGTTLVDWLSQRDPSIRILSVAGKDRSAILPVGRRRASVFWARNGRLTTSTYYADSLPTWATEWNGRSGAARLAGRSWTLLLPDSAYPEPDDAEGEDRPGRRVFPHTFPGDPDKAAAQASGTPWADSLLLDAALTGARAMGIGRRDQPDVLVLGLSATDYIGHQFGPDSREVHDQLLRLDRWLGWFLDSLETSVPADRTIVVLTGDHGVTPIPEVAQARGEDAGRVSLALLVADVNQRLGISSNDPTALTEHEGLVTGSPGWLRERGVNPESLATALLAAVWRQPGVKDAWTPATLRGAVPGSRDAARWSHTIPVGVAALGSPPGAGQPRQPPGPEPPSHAPRSGATAGAEGDIAWFVAASPRPGWVWGGTAGHADHGTTNDDDAGVPIAFLGPGIRTGIFADTVRTVDIAPTLAHLLRVPVPGKIDGRRIKRVPS